MFWFNHLTVLGDDSGVVWHLINQLKYWFWDSSFLFCLKTLIILHSKKIYGFRTNHMHHWRMEMDCYTLVYDQVKLSWFKVIKWCQGSIDPAETWWHGLILKDFIQQRSPLDSKGTVRSLHEWLTSDVPYCHNCLWGFSTSSWLNEFFFSNVQIQNLEDFFSISSFQQSQASAGSIPKSKLKSKISHSLIHMDFIGLVTWSRARGLWKKGSERLKECLRVILSKNLESLAYTPFFWAGLYSFCLIH